MNVHELEAGLKAFAKIDLHINAQTMQAFLAIAHRGECLQRDLERDLGLTTASVSRNVAYWTGDIRKNTGLPGPDFVERKETPIDRRRKILRLTQKGREFFAKIQAS